MSFDDWEIDAIRRALNNYRTARSRNGRQLAWKKVIENILSSTVTTYDFPETGNEPEFLEEALRRFANGTSTLQADKLEDLRKFLLHEDCLTEAELKNSPEDFGSLFSTVACLANDTDVAREIIAELGTSYIGNMSDERIMLTFTVGKSGFFFRVTEEVEIHLERSDWYPEYYSKDSKKIYHKFAKGYGFTTTQHHFFHLFLQDASKNVFTYVQTLLPPTWIPLNKIHFMRCGGSLIASHPMNLKENPEAPDFGIAAFLNMDVLTDLKQYLRAGHD